MSKKKATSKKSAKDQRKSDALTKKALATIEGNIARIEAAERGEKPKADAKAPAKSSKSSKAPKAKREKRMSGPDAAAKVLSESKDPLNAQDIVKAMESKGYWKSPGGKTPHATIYTAMVREIKERGITTIIVEQNAVAALELADRALILDMGQIVFDGTAAEVLDNATLRQDYLAL